MKKVYRYIKLLMIFNYVNCHNSLGVAIPSPRGKTGREGKSTKSWHELCYVTSHFCMEIYKISYWTKAASNTFENAYGVKEIYLVFMTGTVKISSGGKNAGSYTNSGSI